MFYVFSQHIILKGKFPVLPVSDIFKVKNRLPYSSGYVVHCTAPEPSQSPSLPVHCGSQVARRHGKLSICMPQTDGRKATVAVNIHPYGLMPGR